MSKASPKRKHSSSASSISEKDSNKNSKKQVIAITPPVTALPPPLIPYPTGHYIVQQPYYTMYPQTPFYFPVSPHQHPYSVGNNNNTNADINGINNNIDCYNNNSYEEDYNNTSNSDSNMASIVSKGSTHKIAIPMTSSPYPQPFYHPYSIISHTSPTTTTADLREQARKVSHSAIEKRRRERINDKIMQLKKLIPNCAAQENLHKMSILQSAIDYITYLKDIVKSLEENGETSIQLLKGEHLKVKPARSMLPKEVEPFTTQFSVHSVTTEIVTATVPKEIITISNDDDEDSRKNITQQHQQSDTEQLRGLKPIDVIQSTVSSMIDPKAPLTPPQEPTECDAINKAWLNNNNSKPNEIKHMSLSNILC